MTNKAALVLIIITLTSWKLFSQLKDVEPVFQHPSGKGFTYIVRQNTDIKIYKNRCLYRFGFIRFNIDSLGRMDSVYYSQSIPDTLKACIAQGLRSADGHWTAKIKNGRAEYSRPFLLPVEIRLEGGCSDAPDEDGKLSIHRILDFGDRLIKNGLDCIILSPSLIIHRQRDYRIKAEK